MKKNHSFNGLCGLVEYYQYDALPKKKAPMDPKLLGWEPAKYRVNELQLNQK